MRILFDQGTPAPLKRFLPEGETITAAECGWSDLSNGDLKNTPAIPKTGAAPVDPGIVSRFRDLVGLVKVEINVGGRKNPSAPVPTPPRNSGAGFPMHTAKVQDFLKE